MDKLKIYIMVGVASFILLIYLSLSIKIKDVSDSSEMCELDSDCVPATCCHATACVPKEQAPDCEGVFCTQICNGPLDCGAGSCGCINGKCEIIPAK